MKSLPAHRNRLIGGLLALACLLPRLWNIGHFITPDETLFLDYARQFLQGLATGDLMLTSGLGYPGVPVVWTNSLGLLVLFILSRLGLAPVFPTGLSLDQFLGALDIQPLPYYVAARMGTALLVAVLLVLVYVLGRRLFGTKAALVGTLLLAFDPAIMGYSRLVHMAVPLALFMFLSIVAWLLWIDERRKTWLLLSGLFCGLAVSTITMGLLIPPAMLGLALLSWVAQYPKQWHRWSRLKAWASQTAVAWLIALAAAAVTFVVLWPAMWIDPAGALMLTSDWLWNNANIGFGNWGMFWMGRFVLDPGPAFYPIAWLLRISPLVLIGLILNLCTTRRARRPIIEWSLWAYVIFFFAIMTFGPTKSVRYLLPPACALAPLAAFGWLRAYTWILDRLSSRPRLARHHSTLLAAAFGALLLVSSLPYAPYYLSYYNPLVLGWLWAPRVMHVGWGEGLDVAARYLNQKPDADQLSAAAWYDWTFAPFFDGQTLVLSTENVLGADYSVFYVNQIQRNIPDPNLITYFQRRQPELLVRLNGIDYAWVYPAIHSDGPLPPDVIPVDVPMGETVILEGYTTRPASPPGQGLIVTLYWRAQRSGLPGFFVYLRAIDDAGQVRARADSPPVMGFWPTSRWPAGELIADEQVLERPADTPPGSYQLEVGMYDPETWEVLEPAAGQRGAGGGIVLGEITLP